MKRVPPARFGLVFALLLALAPGLGEVVENVLHLVTEGHPAHAQGHGDEHAARSPEHGCTGTFHFCSCHGSATGLKPARSPRVQAQDVIATLALPRAGSTGTGFHHVPERPPRA